MPAAYLKGPEVPRMIERLTGCLGKHRYATPSLASQVAARGHSDNPVEVYRCRACGGWHIGSALRVVASFRVRRELVR